MAMEICLLGDTALVVSYDIKYEKDFEIVLDDFYKLRDSCCQGITDVVLCFKSIGVYFNPDIISVSDVRKYVISKLKQGEKNRRLQSNTVTIPVYYGGEYGPDIVEAAEKLSMSCEELINIHKGKTYRVFGIGFLPGFPYMGNLDPSINLPRKTAPSPYVQPGSVAIAGFQTGIYPVESPGGWHVIGWTPQKLFDPGKEAPCLVKPGDMVRFTRVN